jgi:uracil-DNA glycosylase
MNIYPSTIHQSWDDFLTKDIQDRIIQISHEIGEKINPEPSRVLKFLEMDLDSVKIVVLGQDPYPQKGKATGRCFEVGGLNNWNDKFRQVSLKNIVRLLHKNYSEIKDYKDIKKFSEIQEEINEGQFSILPPNQIFKSWEKQGVLLLNTYLTVQEGVPGSHIRIWEDFGNELISYISTSNPNINWFLWGSKAQEKAIFINHGTLHCSRHPMMCSEKYTDDFLKNECFNLTKHLINWI